MEYEDTYHEVITKFHEGVRLKALKKDVLNGYSIHDYVKEMVKRANGDISHLNLKVENPISFPIIRKTARSYVSKISANKLKMKIQSYNVFNSLYENEIGKAIEDLVEWSHDTSDQKKAFQKKALQATLEGTCIELEGFRDVRQNRKVVDEVKDMNDIKTKEVEEIIERGCFTQIRPLHSILIPDMHEPDIQRQKWIIDIEIMTHDMAKIYYGKYNKFNEVTPGRYLSSEIEYEAPYHEDLFDRYFNLENDQVQILHYFDLSNRYVIMANGVVLYDNVNPYRHGKYPYVKTVHDVFSGVDFFYGRSFVENIASLSDAFNTLYNLILQKQKLASKAFMVGSEDDDVQNIEDFEGGSFIKFANVNQTRIEKFPGLDQGDINIINQLSNEIEQMAGNPSGGAGATTPGGGKMLLAQTMKLEQEAQQSIGYSIFFLEESERDRIRLRISNIIQFLTVPEKLEKLPKMGQKTLVYNTARNENAVLSDGSSGIRIVKIIDTRDHEEDMGAIAEQLTEEEVSTEGNAEAVALSVEDFDMVKNVIKIKPFSTYERDQTSQLQKFIQYMQTRLSVQPNANVPKMLEKLDEIMDFEDEEFGPQQDNQAQALQQLQSQAQQGEQTPEIQQPNVNM